MFEFMVTERTHDGPNPLGKRQFQVAPTTGDIITVNSNAGIGNAYRVIARIFSMDNTPCAGDLEVVHIGPLTTYLLSIGKGSHAS